MVKETREEKQSSEPWSADELRAKIGELQTRIEDLRVFDVKTVQERYDKRVKVLSDEINGAIADIYGQNTPKYWQNAIASLDNLPTVIGGARYPIDKVREVYQMGIDEAITKLAAVVENLEGKLNNLEGRPAADGQPGGPDGVSGHRRVFVIHGRDDMVKETVTSFLAKLDMEPVVLHERSNEGPIVLDEFPVKDSDDFAVFTLTSDDINPSSVERKENTTVVPQNSMFDLGFFLGSLGRKRVVVLRKGNGASGASPFDYYGIRTIALDDGALWELLLARDMKRAGLSVDMNKAV
jgi:predicted nucleotide-binding protein